MSDAQINYLAFKAGLVRDERRKMNPSIRCSDDCCHEHDELYRGYILALLHVQQIIKNEGKHG